jgi:RHS repeat-associated protein
MERTRRDSVCFSTSHDCESTLTRFVWAGDQLLWEMRVPGGNDVPAGNTGLEATSASGDFYGRVSYFHAGGIDKPLLITKEGVESVVPRETWRGRFHAGTSPTTGLVRDCQQGGQTNCLLIAWPGWRTTATHAWGGEESPDIDVWYGGLVDGMRDASGQMYMRNRYYDPATGQFTQTDPIGLAGGLNAYGFAAGDPVSYSDPYGLCPANLVQEDGTCPGGMSHDEYNRFEDMHNRYFTPEGAAALNDMLRNGRIVVRPDTMEGPERRVQTVHFTDARPSYLRIGPDFWNEGDAAAAWTLGHDYGHVIQKRLLGLIYGASTRMDLQTWNLITSTPYDHGAGTMFLQASQRDASLYACSITLVRTSYHDRYCSPGLLDAGPDDD